MKLVSLTQNTADAFSNFRAEHEGAGLFENFTQPQYFPELLTKQPCFLIGGRGTGKTTNLKSLSYKGRRNLDGSVPTQVADWGVVGLYTKISTGRVAAFRGPEASQDQWERLFSHYFNVICCISVLEFFVWFESEQASSRTLASRELGALSLAFSIDVGSSPSEALDALNKELVNFEISINSIGANKNLRLTPLGQPIDLFMDRLLDSGILGDTYFFFLIDEFENLSNYQQRVVNTLIKHARPPYTFKIGVKELGIRERCTLNLSEQLVDPADYLRIDIGERFSNQNHQKFSSFASEICSKRLSAVQKRHLDEACDIREYFPGLSPDEEAIKLGIERIAKDGISDAFAELNDIGKDRFKSMSLLDQYVIWQLEDRQPLKVKAYMEGDSYNGLKDRLNNYKVPMLFNIRKGKSGLRKFYCGWDVFCRMAHGNIRYLLELVHRSIQIQVVDGPSDVILPEIQTEAARYIGQKNLRELEGFSVVGAKMVTFALSLGRVFQQLAEDCVGHTPEITQFDISDSLGGKQAGPIHELIEQCIMHLALVRFAGTKLQQSEDIKDYDYALHPIFSAYFSYSYRQKRKMHMTLDEVLSLAENPQNAIARILERQNRESIDIELGQLHLFGQ